MLWTSDYKTNTVHVDDVARGIWHVCLHGRQGEIYNLADKEDTSRALLFYIMWINCMCSIIFEWRPQYYTLMSSLLYHFAND